MREPGGNVVRSGDGPYACPCCGFLTLSERGNFEVCEVCRWGDEGQDDHDAEVVRGGMNGLLSLAAARRNVVEFGASDPKDRPYVRPPRRKEYPRDHRPQPCPCCGYLTLEERDNFEICDVCFWEDDGQDDEDADQIRGGPNGQLSLSRARHNFAQFGACSQKDLPHVRPPLPEEYPPGR